MVNLTAQRMVCRDLVDNGVNVITIQECKWREVVERHEMGQYVWWGGGAWLNKSKAPVGGVMIGVHRRCANSVEATAHRAGRVQVVKMKGQMGRNLIFGGLYAPHESDGVK